MEKKMVHGEVILVEELLGGQGALKQVSFYKDDKHVSSKYYDFDGDEISKKEALNDEEMGRRNMGTRSRILKINLLYIFFI